MIGFNTSFTYLTRSQIRFIPVYIHLYLAVVHGERLLMCTRGYLVMRPYPLTPAAGILGQHACGSRTMLQQHWWSRKPHEIFKSLQESSRVLQPLGIQKGYAVLPVLCLVCVWLK